MWPVWDTLGEPAVAENRVFHDGLMARRNTNAAKHPAPSDVSLSPPEQQLLLLTKLKVAI